MKLTDHQQKMLDGAFGKGKAMAMQIQIGVGKCFDAERLVPVSRAHVSLSAQEADIWFAGKLLDAGASCTIAPTVNPGYSVDYFRSRLTDAAVENMRKTERIYRGLGARLTYCCTPYLADNVPSYGEIIAFSETNATIYANAVLGVGKCFDAERLVPVSRAHEPRERGQRPLRCRDRLRARIRDDSERESLRRHRRPRGREDGVGL